MENRYDVAIIGNGPAGLSAALTLKNRNKNVIVFANSKTSSKVEKAQEIHNYLGFPEISGTDLAQRFLEHAKVSQVHIVEVGISVVYHMGEYYGLRTRNNEMYEAKTVILAFGVQFGKLYPGEEAFLGRGVSYCATCDAMLYRGKKVVVIGNSPQDEAEANFLADLAEQVYYIPNYKKVESLSEKIQVIYDTPVEITGDAVVDTLVCKNTSIQTDGIFVLRESVAPAQLVPGLAVKDGYVVVNRKMETNLPGCFACGDLTGAPFQYMKAAGEGNVAAISAVAYLAAQ